MTRRRKKQRKPPGSSMPVKSDSSGDLQLGQGKRLLFATITLSIPIVLVLATELLLRAFHYGENLDLVVTKRVAGREFYAINRSVAKKYFTQSGTIVPEPADDLFEIRKSPKTKRIFCLGESTMAGFPYDFNATAPSFLRDRLKTLLPQYNVEVINVGLSAVGSFVVRDFIGELMTYEPDLFIIYLGHNEFYGVYGVGSAVKATGAPWMTRVSISLLRFKTFLALRDLYGWIRSRLSSETGRSTGTLMQEMVGNDRIPYDSDLYRLGRQIYRDNLEAIFDEAKSHGVPVLMSMFVSNVRDQAPFQSVFAPTTSDTQKTLWQELVTAGDKASSGGRHEKAIRDYRAATGIDGIHAEGFYKLGKELEASGDTVAARQALLRAKDLDALRFRATEDFKEDLLAVCLSHHVPVARVDLEFEKACRHNIIGNELILEHLHPNIPGYFLMAKTWCRTMADAALLVRPDDWQWSRDKSDKVYMDLSTASEFDSLHGRIKTELLTHRPPFVSSIGRYEFRPADRVEAITYLYVQGKVAWSDARYQIAEFYAQQKRFDLARRECLAVSKVIPFSYEPLLRVADYFRMEGKNEEAKKAYLHCIQVEDNPYARLKLAIILLEQELAPEAASHIETAFAIDQRTGNKLPREAAATGRYLLAVTYAKLGRSEQARQEIKRSLAIHPDNEDAKILLNQLR